MLLARNQDDLTAMFIWQLAEGDRTYATEGTDYQFTPTFAGVVQKYLDDDQWSDFETMQTNFGEEMIPFIEDRSFNVVKTNRDVVMAEGYLHTAGVFGGEKVYKIYKDQTPIPCTDAVSTSCVGDAWSSMDQADITFNNNVRTNEETVNGRTHTIIGDYWYTDDLLDEYLGLNVHSPKERSLGLGHATLDGGVRCQPRRHDSRPVQRPHQPRGPLSGPGLRRRTR